MKFRITENENENSTDKLNKRKYENINLNSNEIISSSNHSKYFDNSTRNEHNHRFGDNIFDFGNGMEIEDYRSSFMIGNELFDKDLY